MRGLSVGLGMLLPLVTGSASLGADNHEVTVRTAVACILCYGILSQLVFGSVMQPIALMTIWSGRLGLPGWRFIVVASFLAAALACALLPRRVAFGVSLRPPLFVVVVMGLSIVSVGLWADQARQRAIARFQPDMVMQNSIFMSFRRAPADSQFFLHAAAMKQCRPFAWSYRNMDMYPVPRAAARNVMPLAWLKRCGMDSYY